MGIFMLNNDEPIFLSYVNRARREFRRMYPVSLELQNNGYVEIKYLSKNGGENLIRFKVDK